MNKFSALLGLTAILSCVIGSTVKAQAPTQPVAPIDALLIPYRETVYFPSASSSLTIPDPKGTASVTLNLSRRVRGTQDGIDIRLSAKSLAANQCALVSVQLPFNLFVGNEQYQLTTTPLVFVPLTTKAGYCGSANTFRQTYVSEPKTEHQAFLRLPTLPENTNPQIPFTMEVFFINAGNAN